MNYLHEYYAGGSMHGSSQSANKDLVYRNMSGEERKELDALCIAKYGRPFLDCGFEEQSAIRSAKASDADEADEEQEKITKDAEDAKDDDEERSKKRIEKDNEEDEK